MTRFPFALSLSKAVLLRGQAEGRCFDKLSTNGALAGPSEPLAAPDLAALLAEDIADWCGP